LQYAFAARTPRDLGAARSLAARGVRLRDNSYVTVGGQAERRWSLYLEPRGASVRESFFRLLGTDSRIFVHAADTAGRRELAERWSGRLRRFDALPYAESLRDYYRQRTAVTRALAPESVRAQLSRRGATADPVELRDRAGEPIRVAQNENILIDVAFPGELKVYSSRDKYPSAPEALKELARLGLHAESAGEDAEEWRWIVSLPPSRRNEIFDQLSQHEMAFQPREERFTASLASLRLDVGMDDRMHDDRLVIPGQPPIDWARVKSVSVAAPVVISPDAFVLVEGEAPGAFVWVPVLLAMLAGFAAYNVWYLARARRTQS
jgi:hypothetical protein